MIMAKKQSKQRTASSQETDRSNLGTQPQSITVNFPPEHNDSEGRFEKFVNRHHSFFFCVVMAIIIVTYGVFLGIANSNLKRSQERIVNSYAQIQKQTGNSIHAFIEQSVAHRKELQSCLDKQMMYLSKAYSSKDSLSAEKIYAKLYADIEYLREQNECITRIASDSLSLRYRDIASSVMSEKMLELHLNKIEHEYTNITMWASVLTIIFLVFSFFSLFKIEQSRKEIEDLRKKGEEDINGTIANATNIFNGLIEQTNRTKDSYKETIENLIENSQSKLSIIESLITEYQRKPDTNNKREGNE
jgi:cell shape-determining protein MreC